METPWYYLKEIVNRANVTLSVLLEMSSKNPFAIKAPEIVTVNRT